MRAAAPASSSSWRVAPVADRLIAELGARDGARDGGRTQSPSGQDPNNPQPARRKLLLVDDSPTVRSLIKVFLMGRSYEFVEAEDGRVAMLVARSTPLDGAIVDLNMPTVDGLTFLRGLRASERPYMRDLPVILLTGDKSRDARRDGLAAGANAFLQKPVAKARLTDVLDVYLSPLKR
jgi:two-component system chemotaxis response regulator CheY